MANILAIARCHGFFSEEGSGIRTIPLARRSLLPTAIDPYSNWWKRTVVTVLHPVNWGRIGEVRECGARLNIWSYLSKLAKIDAQKPGVSLTPEK